VRCWLLGGVDASAAVCPDQAVSMPVSLHFAGEYTSVLAVDYLALELWADQQNIDLELIHSSSDLGWSAEAAWVDGQWVCSAGERDADECDDLCGLAGGSVGTTPELPTDDPLAEPACEVTCDCNDSNTAYSWIDQPQVLASGA
jgi:hypothetical protein